MLRAAFLAVFFIAGVARSVDFAIPQKTTQLVVVTTPAWNSSTAALQCWSRTARSEKWEKAGAPASVLIGERGLAWGRGLHQTPADGTPRKMEGDRRAPAGIFRLTGAFGRMPEAPAGIRLPWQAITPTLEAVDDPNSRFYNRIVDRAKTAGADWHSSEHMAAIADYALGVEVAHNPKHIPGAGSCIFLHLWLGHRRGTAGCTVLREQDLLTLLRWLDPAQQPVLIQLPQSVAQTALRELGLE